MRFPMVSNLETKSLVALRSQQEFTDYLQPWAEVRLDLEHQLASAGLGKSRWYLEGFCEVCEQPSDFLLDWMYSDDRTPNFRERLLCTRCQLNNRQRFALSWVRHEAALRPRPVSLYLYEQVTPFYQSACRLLSGITVIGSEYLGLDYKSGDMVNNLRHENALALSFTASSFDLIVSNDVLEHVPDFKLALQESNRVLKPGGKLIFTIPFYSGLYQTQSRAKLENGRIVELLPPLYHGNPVSEKGSLVFNDFAWDILDICQQADFKDAYALAYYSQDHGYIGDAAQLLFVAEK